MSTLINPAEDAAHTRAKDAYLWQVIRKFSQYVPDLRGKNEGGTVVLRFVMARDGLPAACYAILDEEESTLTYVRVPYDVAGAAAKIRAAGLPSILAARLEQGY